MWAAGLKWDAKALGVSKAASRKFFKTPTYGPPPEEAAKEKKKEA